MRKLLAPAAVVALALPALWWMSGASEPSAAPLVDPSFEPQSASQLLARVRQSCATADLDAFVAAQRARAEAAPGEVDGWLVLAEAHLERIYTRDVHKALVPGRPTWTELPAVHADDVALGLAALERARELGDDSGEGWRLRMSLYSVQITGAAAILRWQGAISAALENALEREPANPRVQVLLGCRKLFAPRMLGQDARGALPHLIAGAKGLPDDERPLLFAALAAHTLGDAEQAALHLRAALARTPANPFAAAALARLVAGEPDPFGRDAER